MAGGNILRRIPSLTPSEFPNSMPSQHSHGPRFIDSIRAAGIRPDDSDEVKLAKSLLVFATGLGSITSILWLLLYWTLGPRLSSSFPFAFQLLLAGNLLLYIRSGNFDLFRYTQLGLFLFAPFAVQWSMGNIITASGIVLWGLLAPIGALMIFGARQSLAWFIAWLLLVGVSGFFDYYLADFVVRPVVPLKTSMIFFALNFGVVATLIYALLRYGVIEQQRIRDRLNEAHVQLRQEQERAERLLLNILPEPVARRLKDSNQTIADGFSDVTVMFVDIVNFTRVAAGMSPSQVFSMLNRIFSAFDDLAEQYGLEKIKTIGDAYMVAGGLDCDQIDYTRRIAALALTMRDLLARDFTINTSRLQVRIGIGTGPVVAGVVGKKKFIYDLWGDTVNIASRITTEGAPGAIHCDEHTFRRLQSEFLFADPLAVHLKGKGSTVVYHLIGEKADTCATTAVA